MKKEKSYKYHVDRVSQKVSKYVEITTSLHLNHASERVKFYKLKIGRSNLSKIVNEITELINADGSDKKNIEFFAVYQLKGMRRQLEVFLVDYASFYEMKTKAGFEITKEKEIIDQFTDSALNGIDNLIDIITIAVANHNKKPIKI